MMNGRTRMGLNILGAALLLGVLGDALLRATPWGLNVLLWSGALAAGLCILQARRGATPLGGEGRGLLAASVACAAAFAWRDSPTLKLLDGLALCVVFSLLAWSARGRSVRLARLTDYALAAGRAAVDAMFASLPLVLTDVRWNTIPRNGFARHAAAVARGLVIAVPLLFIFAALFMAADAVFEGLVRNNLRLDAGTLMSHALLTAALAWGVGGFLRGALLAGEAVDAGQTKARADGGASRHSAPQPFADGAVPVYTSVTAEEGVQRGAGAETQTAAFKSVTEEPAGRTDAQTGASATPAPADRADVKDVKDAAATAAPVAGKRFSLGAVEVATVLGLLDLLFASFVAVQLRYFFGGSALVQATTGLTYAEYARRGFFELVWVAALVLPLLLGVHSLLRRDGAAARLFRALAGAQLVLLFVIMASAVARMRLYQSEYGLTELRLYTTAFMLWLGLVFVWFGATVLWRERRERFACGALVSAALVVGALHLLNSDAHIVRANAARARAGRAFDAQYASALSADAAPALVATIDSLPRESRCALARGLLARWPSHERADWRTWNVSRERARRVVRARREALGAEASCPRAAQVGPAGTTSSPSAAATDAASGAQAAAAAATANAQMTAVADARSITPAAAATDTSAPTKIGDAARSAATGGAATGGTARRADGAAATHATNRKSKRAKGTKGNVRRR